MTDSDLGVLCTVRSCRSWHAVFNRELFPLAACAGAQCMLALGRPLHAWYGHSHCTCNAQQLFGSSGPARAWMPEPPGVLAAWDPLPALVVLADVAARVRREAVLLHSLPDRSGTGRSAPSRV